MRILGGAGAEENLKNVSSHVSRVQAGTAKRPGGQNERLPEGSNRRIAVAFELAQPRRAKNNFKYYVRSRNVHENKGSQDIVPEKNQTFRSLFSTFYRNGSVFCTTLPFICRYWRRGTNSSHKDVPTPGADILSANETWQNGYMAHRARRQTSGTP